MTGRPCHGTLDNGLPVSAGPVHAEARPSDAMSLDGGHEVTHTG